MKFSCKIFCEFFYAIVMFWNAAQRVMDEIQTAMNNAKRARDEEFEQVANLASKKSAALRADILEAKRHASEATGGRECAERLRQEELSVNAAAATQAARNLDAANARVRRLEGARMRCGGVPSMT